jgi:signal transduction histidine kinase/ligand-binding sensor domain-containing protein
MTDKITIWMKALPERLSGIILLCIFSFFFCLSVNGLDRDRSLTQFYHTAWTAKDGAPSQISSIAQTADGYVWIGSARGLFRFDGVQFELYTPPAGTELPSHNIYALTATPDDGLWISFRPSGLGFLKDGIMRVFTSPDEIPKSWVYCFARDLDNRIWAGTHTGLALLDGSRWIDVGAAWNIAPERIRTMFVDRGGTLWVATDSTVVFLPRGAKSFQQTGARIGTVPRMAQAADGRVWMTELTHYARPVPLSNQTINQNSAEVNGNDLEIIADANDMLFDRDGSLLITCSDGIKRVRFPEKLAAVKLTSDDSRVETFKAADGLTDNPVHNLFEDREGNIWVTSAKGLDRFRYSSLVPVKLPPGHQYSTLLAGEHGEIWAGNAVEKNMVVVRGEDVIEQSAPMEISSVYRDADSGDVWWGGAGGIWRRRENQADFFPQPNMSGAPEFVWEIFRADDSGGLWVGLGDVGLIYFNNGVWGERSPPPDLPERSPSASFRDAAGRVWLGYTENLIYSLDADQRVHAFTREDGIDIGRIRVIRGRRPGRVWFGGELGLAFFDGSRFRQIKTSGGESFGTVAGIIETADGSLWLNELRGVIRISAGELEQAAQDPDHAVNYRLFDFLDGLPGGGQMNYTVSTAVEGTDGRLWFATDNGLAWLDPRRISENIAPPPVSIRLLQASEKIYDSFSSINLAAGTQSLRIDYTALSFSIPERVRFKYKLEGSDADWQDAGIRRQAFYNNLKPGNYSFRVIACNNDGVWNEEGANLQFTIAPEFYQTNWFLLLCFAGAGCLVWVGYRWRIYHIKHRLQLQFEERLDERTRIAQDLHDTLLQGVFSASVQLDAATEQLRENSPLKPKLGRVSQLMHLVLTEGRNTVRGLRSQGSETVDLAKAFTEIKQDLDVRGQIDFRLIVNGEVQRLHPIVRDEIYRLGREALVNAFRHSKAKTIEVEIEYSPKYFKLRVRDNGCGISPEILRTGRAGHLGLPGMREGSDRIGAKFKIESRAESGTEVELSVPYRLAFNSRSPGRASAWLYKLGWRSSEKQNPVREDEQ